MNSTNEFFFNKPDFVFRNPAVNTVAFFSIHKSDLKIYFTQHNTTLISLRKSPFGSFTGSGSEKEITGVIEDIENWSIANGIDSIIIHSYPEIYNTEECNKIRNVLLNNGFEITYQDLAQIILIDAKTFLPNQLRRRKLKRCIQKCYVFRKLSLIFLPEAYKLIVESRLRKKYPITMELSEITAMFKSFPDHYLLFGVFDYDKMVASAVMVVVNQDILYYFYSGYAGDYRKDSPITLLIQGIYQFCLENHFRILDMGISTDKGKLNEGLYAFKKSLGCFDTPKITYSKHL